MGVACGTGRGVDALWNAARAGQSAVREITFTRPAQNRVKIAAYLRDFQPERYFDPIQLRLMDRFSQLATVAADEAMAQAGLSRHRPCGDRTAVIVGSGIGGGTAIDDMYADYYAQKTRLNPLTIPRVMANAASSNISIRYGCTGPTFSVASACCSSSQAIGMGAILIRAGLIDLAIVGGSEASLVPTYLRAWELLRVLTPDICRPFSKQRTGMVLGEGAGIFVLENVEAADNRGSSPLAEIVGYGTSSDAKDLIRPDVDGEAQAMRLALEDARLVPEDIDYINAHGTGTILNDIVEVEALRKIFGGHLSRLAVSSTKPIHGHAIGASGALELAITVMALRENIAPPTINWLEADPECDLDVVPNHAREMAIRIAMSNSFGFGGINASLIITRYK
jgi:nodulation protein E